MPLTPRKRPLAEAVCLPCQAGRKLGEVATALLGQGLQADPACPSRGLLAKVAHTQPPMAIRLRHRHRWRVKWPRHRRKGRPRHAGGNGPVSSGADVVAFMPPLACGGVPLCADGLDHQESCAPIGALLLQAIQASKSPPPDDACAL
jgi:hypothetical protein